MEIKKYNDYSEFVKSVMDNMESVRQNITIVAFYEDASAILKHIAKYEKSILHSIDIHDYMWENYDSEYYITLSKDDEGDYLIYCEKAYDDKKDVYLYGESNIVYIAEDCSAKVLKRLYSDIYYEVRFFDDEEDDFDKMVKTMMNVDEIEMDEDMKGFTVSRSDDYGFSTFSFHSTDEDLVKRVLKDYKKF